MSEIYNISGILQRLNNVKKSGNNHTAKCPAHDDKQNSLSISEKPGKIVMHCHAGCSVKDVCAALGIEVKDLFLSPETNQKEKSRIVATYDYKDENGNLLFQAVKNEPKKFWQRQPDGRGGWINNLKGVRRVLYRLPELIASVNSAAFVCEGEKDADLLRSHGLTATTCALGAGKWRDEYSDSLINRICYILPDNDKPGRDHAIQVAKSLHGKAREIRIVKLPVSKEKGDVSDWFQAGHTKEELLALVEQTAVWTGETEDETESISRGEKSGNLNVLSASLFNGGLTLEVSRDGKRFKVVAKNSSGSLGMNVFNLAESAKRAKFVKDLGDEFDENQRKEINRALIQLADEADSLPAAYDPVDGKTITTSFEILTDGRIIEQIKGGFALYDPEDDTYSIVEKVEDSDGTIYVPDSDELLSGDRGMHIANAIAEYGTIADLDAALEAYIFRNADVGDLQRKIIAKYIRLTYICDQLFEIPYIAPTGDGGNGKTRVGELIVFASRRGMTLVNPSASSVFRNVNDFQPTLFIDEMNLTETGDDTAAILQILNSGIKRLTGFVSRIEKGPDGKFRSSMFNTFGAKIIGSLKKTNSMPFNSRCIPIEMQATKRTDIPFGTFQEMLDESQSLRNKLVLYRLRYCTTNFEPKLKEAEQTMKAAGLRPRTIQVNTPLLALTDDPVLRNDFIRLLQDADKVRVSEKLETLDGEIVQAIHEIIFDENGKVQILFDHGVLCQDLRVEQILEAINADRKEKDKIDARRMGQLLNRNFKLKTKKIDVRNEHRDKKALIFDCQALGKLFENFSLSGFPEDACRQCRQDAINNADNDLAGDKQNLDGKDLSPNKSNKDNSYEVATSGDKSFEENREKENNSHTSPFYAEPPIKSGEEFFAAVNGHNQSRQPANSGNVICNSCGALTKMDELCVSCGEWNISI